VRACTHARRVSIRPRARRAFGIRPKVPLRMMQTVHAPRLGLLVNRRGRRDPARVAGFGLDPAGRAVPNQVCCELTPRGVRIARGVRILTTADISGRFVSTCIFSSECAASAGHPRSAGEQRLDLVGSRGMHWSDARRQSARPLLAACTGG
jgi:hypothetical protein